MRAIVVVVFVVASICQISAQVPELGKCQQVTTQLEFDLNKYLGSWYEINRFYTSFENDNKCVVANYSIPAPGQIKVFNRAVDIKTGKKLNATGEAIVPDPKFPAKLKVRANSGAPYSDYWIVETDYVTYSLIFSCMDLIGLGHLEFSWILSRSRTLDSKIVDTLKSKMEGFGVKISNYGVVDQTKCPF